MRDIRRYPLVSNQVDHTEVGVIVRELERVIGTGVEGGIVEFGCYEGTTSLFIARALREMHDSRAFHVYDSFEGLPTKTAQDNSPAGTQFRDGELRASKATFIKHFKHAGLPMPHIHKGWFANLADTEVPSPIAFAFLDGDFYESISDSLRLIERKLSDGAVIIIDDYQSEALPGARKAVDAWLKGKAYRLRTEHSLAVIQI